jgi:hypothetical protein
MKGALSKTKGVLKRDFSKLSGKTIAKSLVPQMLVLGVTLFSNVACSQIYKLAVFVIKFGSGHFYGQSWMFVCSIRSFWYMTLGVKNAIKDC